MIDQVKIATVAFQLMSQLPFVLNIKFPHSFEELLEHLKILNFDLFGDFSVTCLIDDFMTDFRLLYMKFVLYMVLPPLLVSLVYRNYNTTKRRLARDMRQELNRRDRSILHPPNDAVQVLRTQLEKSTRSCLISIRNNTNCYMKLQEETSVDKENRSRSAAQSSRLFVNPDNIGPDYPEIDSDENGGDSWGQLVGSFNIKGGFDDVVASHRPQTAGKETGTATKLFAFEASPSFNELEYEKTMKTVYDADWDMLLGASSESVKWPKQIPPKTEVIVAIRSDGWQKNGIRMYLTYELVEPASSQAHRVSPPQLTDKVRFEVFMPRHIGVRFHFHRLFVSELLAVLYPTIPSVVHSGLFTSACMPMSKLVLTQQSVLDTLCTLKIEMQNRPTAKSRSSCTMVSVSSTSAWLASARSLLLRLQLIVLSPLRSQRTRVRRVKLHWRDKPRFRE